MNRERVEEQTADRWLAHRRNRSENRVVAGFFLLAIGALLFLRTSKLVLFPGWFFEWPMAIIGISLFVGLKNGFRSPIVLIWLFVGIAFTIDNINPAIQLDKYIWPILLMIMGLIFILRPKNKHGRRWEKGRNGWQQGDAATSPFMGLEGEASADRRDFIEATAVFGGIKKSVLSKNFKGGEITSVMGGSEIDLTQADFTGTITIDVTTAFGGSKLIVPPTWDVHNEIAAVFGGVDDKRQIMGVAMDPSKVLILEGTCVFGGLEIRSY
jgi:predicted membrane protein